MQVTYGFPWYDCCIYIVMLTCLVQPKFRYPVLCIWKASEEVVVLGPQLVGVFLDSLPVKSCSFGISDTNMKIHLHCVLHRLAVVMSSLLAKAICSSIHCYLSLDVARMRRHTFVYWRTLLL